MWGITGHVSFQHLTYKFHFLCWIVFTLTVYGKLCFPKMYYSDKEITMFLLTSWPQFWQQSQNLLEPDGKQEVIGQESNFSLFLKGSGVLLPVLCTAYTVSPNVPDESSCSRKTLLQGICLEEPGSKRNGIPCDETIMMHCVRPPQTRLINKSRQWSGILITPMAGHLQV